MGAARHVAWSLPAILVIVGCGSSPTGSSMITSRSSTTTAETVTTFSETATSSASSGVPAVTPGGATAEQAAFACASHSGGDASVAAQLVAVRTAHQSGFDRVTFEFASPAGGPGRSGFPAYRVTPQGSPRMVRDPSGQPVTLQGSAALRVVVQHASGFDMTASPARATYSGGRDLRPALPAVREVEQLGDFERVLSWGIGLASPVCSRVVVLGNPTRIAVDVQSP